MTEELVREIAKKSDEELLLILENYTNFEEVIILVVCLELDKRRILEPQYFSLRDSLVHKYFQQPRVEKERKKISSWKQLFMPNKLFMVTQIIVLLNVLVYLVMIVLGVHFFSPTAQDLLFWGGSTAYLSLTTEPWRLITSMFLHGGILHLFFNMYALLYVGTFLETLVGKTRYVMVYLLSGIFATLFSIFFKIPEYSHVVGVGASGAIFGMFGLFIIFLLVDRKVMPKQARNQMLQSMGFFLIINLVILGSYPGIDNAAHIGGLIFGVFAGLTFFLIKIRASILNSVFIAVSILSMVFFYTYLGQKVQSYDNSVESIENTQEKAFNIIDELLKEWNNKGYDKTRVTIYKKKLGEAKKILKEVDTNIQPKEVKLELYKEHINFWIRNIENLENSVDSEENFKKAFQKMNAEYSKWSEKLKR